MEAEVARGGKRGRDGGEVRSHGEEVERHIGGEGDREVPRVLPILVKSEGNG